MLLKFHKCINISESESNNNAECEENAWLADNESNGKEHSQVFEFVDVPSFFALISCNSLNQFSFSRLNRKKISEKILRDCYGHTVLDGDMFFTGKYLQKVR